MAWIVAVLAICFATLVSGLELRASSARYEILQNESLHVAVTSIPLYGHYLPMRAVVESLVAKGHRVSLLLEKQAWCDEVVGSAERISCIPLSQTDIWKFSEISQDNVSALDGFGELFKMSLRYHDAILPSLLSAMRNVHATSPIDVVFTDTTNFAGHAVADAINTPYVTSYPLTLNVMPTLSTEMPPMGTGIRVRESPLSIPGDDVFGHLSTLRRFYERLATLLIRLVTLFLVAPSVAHHLDKVRLENNISSLSSPFDIGGMRGPIIAPTIWGFDLPQSVCPTVFAVGLLEPHLQHDPMESDLDSLLNAPQCESGVIYVNFGTLAELSGDLHRQVLEMVRAVLERGMCVVWKISHESHRRDAMKQGDGERVFIASHFSNPRRIMSHPRMKVFVTHCGDTSVGEAIAAALPLVGVPMFADQVDVCARVFESGIGFGFPSKLAITAERLISAVLRMSSPGDSRAVALQSLRQVLAVSKRAGGAPMAVDIIERSVRLGIAHAGGPLTCHIMSAPNVTRHPGAIRSRWNTYYLDAAMLMELDRFVFFSFIPALILFFIGRRFFHLVVGICRIKFMRQLTGDKKEKSD